MDLKKERSKHEKELKVALQSAVHKAIMNVYDKIYDGILSEDHELNARVCKLTAEILGDFESSFLKQSEAASRKAAYIRKRQHLTAQCPHCSTFHRPEDLLRLSDGATVEGVCIKGAEDVVMTFFVAKCPNCKKKMYAEYDTYSPTPFYGEIFPNPVSYHRFLTKI